MKVHRIVRYPNYTYYSRELKKYVSKRFVQSLEEKVRVIDSRTYKNITKETMMKKVLQLTRTDKGFMDNNGTLYSGNQVLDSKSRVEIRDILGNDVTTDTIKNLVRAEIKDEQHT